MKGKDFIGIAGILLFAATYAVDQLVRPLPTVAYLILVAISMVLLVIGMVSIFRRHR